MFYLSPGLIDHDGRSVQDGFAPEDRLPGALILGHYDSGAKITVSYCIDLDCVIARYPPGREIATQIPRLQMPDITCCNL